MAPSSGGVTAGAGAAVVVRTRKCLLCSAPEATTGITRVSSKRIKAVFHRRHVFGDETRASARDTGQIMIVQQNTLCSSLGAGWTKLNWNAKGEKGDIVGTWRTQDAGALPVDKGEFLVAVADSGKPGLTIDGDGILIELAGMNAGPVVCTTLESSRRRHQGRVIAVAGESPAPLAARSAG